MDIRVELVEAVLTVPLRHQVLRPHQRPQDLVLPAESAAGAAHVAALTPAGAVVGTAVVLPESFPLLPARPAGWRLRGMAIAPELRDRGIGGRVLGFAIEHVAGQGGRLLWCHARIPARRFYQRAGFQPIGQPWQEEHTGPHIAMWRDVDSVVRRQAR